MAASQHNLRNGFGPGGCALHRPGAFDKLLQERYDRIACQQPNEEGHPHVVHVWTEWDGEATWLLCPPRPHSCSTPRPPEGSRSFGSIRCRSDSGPDPRRGLDRGKARRRSILAARHHHVALRMAIDYKGDAGARSIDQSLDWPRCLVRIDPVKLIGWGDVDWHRGIADYAIWREHRRPPGPAGLKSAGPCQAWAQLALRRRCPICP